MSFAGKPLENAVTVSDPADPANKYLKPNSDGSINVKLETTPTIDIGNVGILGKDNTTRANTGGGTATESLRVNLATDVALPAGTNLVGKVGIDQTTPGTTNNVTTPAIGSNGSAAKTSSTLVAVSDGTNQQQLIAPIALADGVNGNNSVSVGNYVWNGASWDRLPGTTSGLKVLAQAGQATIGNVGGKTVSVTVTPTVTASNAYGTNYVVGGLLTFANAFTSTGSGILQSVCVTINKVETGGFTFFPFNANPNSTTWTDAAVANINAADVAKMRNPVSLNSNSQLGTCTVASATGLGEAMAPGITSLYGVLIANAALTNNFTSTSDVTVTVKILQDV